MLCAKFCAGTCYRKMMVVQFRPAVYEELTDTQFSRWCGVLASLGMRCVCEFRVVVVVRKPSRKG